jgi:stage V sporulation protein B
VEQISKFFFDIGWVLVGTVVNMGVSFLLRMFLARWLGAADLGLYTMIITIQEIAALIASIGIGIALVKFVAEWINDKKQLYRVTSSSFLNTMLLNIAGSVLLFFLSGLIASLFKMPELVNLLKILAFALPLLGFLETAYGLFNGLREMKAWTFLMVFRSILMAIFTIVPVWLGFGIRGAVVGIGIAALGTSIWAALRMRKLIRWDLGDYLYYTKRVISFGGWALCGNLISILSKQIDIMMVGYFLVATQVGYYSTALTLSQFFALIPMAIQRIIFPAASTYFSQAKHGAVTDMIDKSMKYATCVLLPVALGVGFYSRQIITLAFGSEFHPAVIPLCILLVARVITGGTATTAAPLLGAAGRPELNLIPNSIAVVTIVGLSILFIPSYGITGAAVATALTLLVWTCIYFVLVIRVLHIKINFMWFLLAFGSGGIATGLFIAGTQVLNPYIVGSSILIVFIIFVLMVLLKKEDRAIFKSLINSVLHR